jgi:hypothetical protein
MPAGLCWDQKFIFLSAKGALGALSFKGWCWASVGFCLWVFSLVLLFGFGLGLIGFCLWVKLG